MKNIKQISEQTGISKVSLYKLIRKPKLKDHIIKDGNTMLIDDVGEQIIIEYYTRQRLTSLNGILDENTEKAEKLKENEEANQVNKHGLQDDNHVKNLDFIQILENQLNAKDEQIKEKDNQIQMKDEQIRQKDNQLNALLILLNKEKEIQLIGNNNINDKTDAPPESLPKKLFSRLFRKK